MAETDLNKRLRDALRGFDLVRVENAVGPGTPDINYTYGWIESKQLSEWPARATSIVRIPHYVADQRGWHVRRSAAGGHVWVALEVAGVFHLFYADQAAARLGLTWTRDDCRRAAALYLPKWDATEVRKFFLDYHDIPRYSDNPAKRPRTCP